LPEAGVELRPGVEATGVELQVELQYKAAAVYARRVYTTHWRQEWCCNLNFGTKDFRELLAEELSAEYDLSLLRRAGSLLIVGTLEELDRHKGLDRHYELDRYKWLDRLKSWIAIMGWIAVTSWNACIAGSLRRV
jgi:hypothetical protein